jgi:iron(III) transport system permease protein
VQLFRTLPVAFLMVWHALRLVPAETLETAALEGAGPLVRLWKVVLPQIAAALACAWLAALALSMAELSASILLVPPGVNTLAIRIFGLVHYGVEDQLAALSLAVAALFAALAGGVLRLARVAEGGNL